MDKLESIKVRKSTKEALRKLSSKPPKLWKQAGESFDKILRRLLGLE